MDISKQFNSLMKKKGVDAEALPVGRKIDAYSRQNMVKNLIKPGGSKYAETKNRLDALKQIDLEEDPEFFKKRTYEEFAQQPMKMISVLVTSLNLFSILLFEK